MKFDQFTLSATPAGNVFIVGYSADGSDNLRFTAASLPISTVTQNALNDKDPLTQYKDANFTAVVGRSYNVNDSGDGVTVTNPASATEGDFFAVFVQGGSVTVGGIAYTDGVRIEMHYVGGGWERSVFYPADAPFGTAATRDVGQAAGNVLELSAAGSVLLGGPTQGGTLRLYDIAANDEIADMVYQNGEFAFGGVRFPAYANGYVALASDLAAYVPVTRTVNGQALSGNITITDGSGFTSLNASNLSSGTVSLARLVNTQTVGNANATITAGTRDVLLTSALTAPRTYTLPAASGYPAGSRITFCDTASTLTTTNTATLARAGADTINGGTSLILNTAGASPLLISDGASRWNLDIRGVSRGGTGAISLTANNVLLGNGTNPVQSVAPSTTGNVLTSNGTTWVSSAPSGGSVAVGSITGLGTGVATALAAATNGTGGLITWASAPSFSGLTLTGSSTVAASGAAFQVGSVFTSGGTGLYLATSGTFSAGARLQSFTDGILRISNNGSSGGVNLNVATTDTVRVMNFANNAAGILGIGSATTIRTGTGTPEGAVTSSVGSLFLRTDGGAATTLYVKESGAGNTGWVAK